MIELVGGATDASICMLIFICAWALVCIKLLENLLGIKGAKLLEEVTITSECLGPPISALFTNGLTC